MLGDLFAWGYVRLRVRCVYLVYYVLNVYSIVRILSIHGMGVHGCLGLDAGTPLVTVLLGCCEVPDCCDLGLAWLSERCCCVPVVLCRV